MLEVPDVSSAMVGKVISCRQARGTEQLTNGAHRLVSGVSARRCHGNDHGPVGHCRSASQLDDQQHSFEHARTERLREDQGTAPRQRLNRQRCVSPGSADDSPASMYIYM